MSKIASFYQPSVTTNEIDKAVHEMIIDAGAYPSPLGYGGFPKSVCTSVNECMCHGIPDSRQLQVWKSQILCLMLLIIAQNETLGWFSLTSSFDTFLQDGDIINIDVTVYLNVRYFKFFLYFWLYH